MRPHSLKTSAHAFLAIVAAGFLTVAPTVPTVLAQDSGASGGSAVADAGSSVSVLLTRQNERTRLLEEDMQGLRGLVETDLRALKMQIMQLSNNASSDETTTSAEIRDLRDQVERLADAVAMASRRMERTLEMTSDMEFRLLRMEKRLQTLMNFGGEELASAAVQDDTIAAGEGADVSMSRDAETGEVTWQMNESKLEEQLAAAGGSPQPDTDGADGTDTTGSNDATAASDVASAANANIKDAESDAAAAVPAGPEVLPVGSSEEQYNFALGRAMQNDLETAEAAFAEFRRLHPGDEREADALFWLGRIQYLRQQYERAAITFSEFSRIYPDDARIGDTTLLIAESVSKFAPAEQACTIYKELPNLVAAPTDQFTAKLAALSEAANCGS
jgi:TolA-binding protein